MGSASYTKGAKRVGGNHEWTRMARRGNSEPRVDTNGHEWNHEIQEWNHETHEKHEKRQGG